MSSTAVPSLPVRDEMEERASCELPIQGMTCASCVRRVERALLGVSGVAEATVNLVTERATVRFDATQATPRMLADAIEKAGYEVPGRDGLSAASAASAARPAP